MHNRLIKDLNKPLNSNYEFGKLYNNHPIYGVQYFKNEFSDNQIILDELKNMENYDDKFEYHCSYNYLQYLIMIHHPEFFNN